MMFRSRKQGKTTGRMRGAPRSSAMIKSGGRLGAKCCLDIQRNGTATASFSALPSKNERRSSGNPGEERDHDHALFARAERVVEGEPGAGVIQRANENQRKNRGGSRQDLR